MLFQGCSSQQILKSHYDSAEQLLDDAVQLGIPGISVCYGSVDNYQCLQKGMMELESKTKVTSTTQFRTASITKTFTQALLFKLVELELLDITKRFTDYVQTDITKNIPHIEQVKIIDLIRHQSGIFNFTNTDDFELQLFTHMDLNSEILSPDDLLLYVINGKNSPSFLPGESTEYSNTGYILLGILIEEITGLSYAQALSKYILIPSGMANSSLEGRLTTSTLAANYTYANAWERLTQSQVGIGNGILKDRDSLNEANLYNVSNERKFFNAWAWSAGALSSSATDLAKFLEMYLDGRYQTVNNPEKIAQYKTYGWMGGTTGIDVLMMYDVKEKNIYVVMLNATNAVINSNDIYIKLRKLVHQ